MRHDAASLALVVDRLVAAADELKELAASLGEREVEAMEFGAKSEFHRSMKAIEKFAADGKAALQDVLAERGEYEAKKPPPAPKKRPA